MTDAPEKIWAWKSADDFGYGGWSLTDDWEAALKTEYTRTDIAQARIATAREDALREAASLCEGVGAFADEMEKPILELIGNESKPRATTRESLEDKP